MHRFVDKSSNSDFARTVVKYKTDFYPLSRNDGTLVCDRTAAPGSNDSFLHSGIANNTVGYYAAFAIDSTGNASVWLQTIQMPSSQYCYRDQFPYGNGAGRTGRLDGHSHFLPRGDDQQYGESVGRGYLLLRAENGKLRRHL